MKSCVSAETLYELTTVTSPAVAPDGKSAAIVVTKMDKQKNDYIANIYGLDIQKSSHVSQWTFGNDKHISPKWSSTGALAYLSNRTGKMQVYVKQGMAEAEQLTDLENGVNSFFWSPDGSKIAFAAYKQPEKTGTSSDWPKPLVIEAMKYKSDERGLFDGSLKQIGVVDIATKKWKWVTDSPADVNVIDFSANGRAVLVAGSHKENNDFTFAVDVWFIDLDTGAKTQITKEPMVVQSGSVSPDGFYVALLGHEREYKNATLTKLYVYDCQKQEIRLLSGQVDASIGDVAIGDFLQNIGSNGLKWGEDGQSIYALVSKEGDVNVWSFSLDGTVNQVTHEKRHINGFDFQNGQGIVTISDVKQLSEAYRLELATGTLHELTSFNDQPRRTYEFSGLEEICYKREDGSFVAGWLMKPIGFEEGKTYPLVLEVHGGPHAMYARTYFHEFQLLCAKGFGVLFTNPRGGLGYGQAFADAVRGDYGGGDFQDLMDVLDFTIGQHSWIDQERIGLTGGSYGGFMTNWAVGHTNRFKAAVTQRSISNWISFYGVSDIGYYFSEWQIKADLHDIETLWAHSPLKYVENVETPLLILHGEKDYRCPIEQAEQLFIALKKHGKETVFIRFPEANHELSRSGKPNLRIERLNAIADWFSKRL
ncbi:MAG: Peptidase-S9 domain-containing protein [Shouchella clausii]|jgi:dipeptidyl aminopeptidase/acylaminoacyl peptidase